MVDEEKNLQERERQDARELAEFLKKARRDSNFHKIIGVALSSYIHGVQDTCKSFEAAQVTT